MFTKRYNLMMSVPRCTFCRWPSQVCYIRALQGGDHRVHRLIFHLWGLVVALMMILLETYHQVGYIITI